MTLVIEIPTEWGGDAAFRAFFDGVEGGAHGHRS
jgi:hypothetical protein